MMHPRLRHIIPAAFVLASAVALRAENYAITTFAGTINVAGGADGTPGTFNNPYAVAIDAAKNLYVSDTQGNTIRKITPARVVSTLAGTAGASGSADGTGAAARFNFPVGIGVDNGGNVYVADSKNFTIRKITPAGVVTTFAGAAFQLGSADGTGSAARFFLPHGLAVDSAGNVYVADGGNHLIRKITPAGAVTTLAGGALQPGFADATGGAARFNTPFGLAVDGAGNLYVADSGNHAIRKVTSAGVVTTVAGSTSGVSGWADATGTAARFNQPRGVSVDGGGNLYVADYGNQVVRMITPAGVVSTLAGSAGVIGAVDSVGAAARFYDPTGIVADGTTVYVADTSNNLVRRGVPASTAGLPVIGVQPIDQEVSVGQSVTLRVVATGSGLTYQWLKNGVPIASATSSTFTVNSAQEADAGAYTVRVSGATGSVDSSASNLTVSPVGSGPITFIARPLSQAVNSGQSVTFSVTAGGSNLMYQWLKNGAIINGATNSSYTIPSAQVSDAATYTVRVTSGSTTQTASAKLVVDSSTGAPLSITSQPSNLTVNAGQSAVFTVEVNAPSAPSFQWFKNNVAIAGANGATYSIPATQTSDAGSYTVRVTAGSATVTSSAAILTVNSGQSAPAARLINLSILTDIAAAGDTFTMGYVVGGAGTSGTKPTLIRAVGPTLGAAPFNVPGTVADPKLETFAGQTKSGENDNWGGSPALSTAFSSVGAFPYVNAGSLDAAISGSVNPGDNSVRVSANANGTGVVLAEIYDSTPSNAVTASTPRLINVSVLKNIGSGLTAGFVVSGTGTQKVLIRAVGPTLGQAPFNVPGVVSNPQLTLFRGPSTIVGSNDNWGGTAELTTAFSSVGAFPLPAASQDAALLATLQPGDYTVQVTGVGGATGVAIVEVYEVP